MITDQQRQVLDCLWFVIPKPVAAFEFCAAATQAMSACGVIDLESCIYYLEPIHPASTEYIGILRQPTR